LSSGSSWLVCRFGEQSGLVLRARTHRNHEKAGPEQGWCLHLVSIRAARVLICQNDVPALQAFVQLTESATAKSQLKKLATEMGDRNI